MSVQFKTIPPVVAIPQNTECHVCWGKEEENPGTKRWAYHPTTDEMPCHCNKVHVTCMERLIDARVRLNPELELTCPCKSLIVKFDGKYVGSPYRQLKSALSDNNEPAIQAVFSQLARRNNFIEVLDKNSIESARIFRKAAETDDRELLNKLLNSPLATSQNLSIALQSAASLGHSDFLRILLASRLITQDARGGVAAEIARKGHTDCLRILLASGPITKERRGWAAVEAAKKGHTDCLRILLASGPITEENRGTAAILATGKNRIDCLQMVLENGPITEDARGRAAVIAARDNHIDRLQMLLASGPIKEDARGSAAKEAATNGHTDCLQMVLGNGPIPEKSRILALCDSIINNHESCLRLLLPGREELGTVGNGIQDYLQVLLQQKQLSPKEQGACLRGAANQGDLASVTELCQQESILQEDFNGALHYCQDPECIRVLLKNRLFTEEEIELTLQHFWTPRFRTPLMALSETEKECFDLLVEHKKSLQKERTASIVELPRIVELQGKEPLSRSVWVKTAFAVGAAAIGLLVNYTNQVEAD